ncbi:hypothetical protein [Phytoactinopolyspora endophytica]|uniref:hypothetical protein n=1 Tax=Phytoactinopolyspora endophytica TaxID=1642495 RepID=UPI00101C975C|nr:hypothetical protein [Phytoactinopolyspora endophytica]
MSGRYEPIGDLRPDRGPRGDRPVLVPGKSAGGPDRLDGNVVDALIDCEHSGAATVLLAGEAGDLDTPVAAVCRYAAAAQPDVAEEARRRFGVERVYAVDSVDLADAGAWVGRLPRERRDSARWRRGVRTIFSRITTSRT